MAAVIHGASHKAIKLFRKHPAALGVYWDYCARANYEGVAFPGLRGLAKDTGWSVPECKQGRDWLVAGGALERVEGYVRPEWRKLPDAEKQRRLNFDHSEYFRPTALLRAEGITYMLLYEAQRDNEDDGNPDVQPGFTSNGVARQTPLDVQPGDTELDSSKALDPSKEKLSLKEEEEVLLQPPRPNSFSVYESEIGLITPSVAEKIKDWLKQVPPDWVDDAIKEASLHNKRSWAYVEAILKRWQTEGRGGAPVKTTNGSAPAPTSALTSRGVRPKQEV